MTEKEFWKSLADAWNTEENGSAIPRRQVKESFDMEEDGLKEFEDEVDDILADLGLDF